MAGAASHIDLFDYKPELVKRHGQPSDFGEHGRGVPERARAVAEAGVGFQAVRAVAARCSARPSRRSAAWWTTWRSSTTSSASPASTRPATLLQATGFVLPGFPGAGCWVSYGLGSMNDNLPTFVVLPDHRGFGSNGVKNWDSAFLPVAAQRHDHLSRRGDADRGSFSAQERRLRQREERGGGAAAHGRAQPRARGGARGRPAARCAHPQLRTRREDATRRARGARTSRPSRSTSLKLYGLDRGPQTWAKEINAEEETVSLRAEMPRRAPAARARRALRADLERQRQRLPAPQLGFARGHRARPRPARARHGARLRGVHPGSEAARHARRHDHPVDDRIRPHAVRRKAARGAITIRSSSPTGSAAAASRAASRTAKATSGATSRSTANNPTQVLRHPRHDPAPARHRPHEAHLPPQRHRPPPDRRAWRSHPLAARVAAQVVADEGTRRALSNSERGKISAGCIVLSDFRHPRSAFKNQPASFPRRLHG